MKYVCFDQSHSIFFPHQTSLFNSKTIYIFKFNLKYPNWRDSFMKHFLVIVMGPGVNQGIQLVPRTESLAHVTVTLQRVVLGYPSGFHSAVNQTLDCVYRLVVRNMRSEISHDVETFKRRKNGLMLITVKNGKEMFNYIINSKFE